MLWTCKIGYLGCGSPGRIMESHQVNRTGGRVCLGLAVVTLGAILSRGFSHSPQNTVLSSFKFSSHLQVSALVSQVSDLAYALGYGDWTLLGCHNAWIYFTSLRVACHYFSLCEQFCGCFRRMSKPIEVCYERTKLKIPIRRRLETHPRHMPTTLCNPPLLQQHAKSDTTDLMAYWNNFKVTMSNSRWWSQLRSMAVILPASV